MITSAAVRECMVTGPSVGSRVSYNPHPPFAVDRPRPSSGKLKSVYLFIVTVSLIADISISLQLCAVNINC